MYEDVRLPGLHERFPLHLRVGEKYKLINLKILDPFLCIFLTRIVSYCAIFVNHKLKAVSRCHIGNYRYLTIFNTELVPTFMSPYKFHVKVY
jgi:hypothetical protein